MLFVKKKNNDKKKLKKIPPTYPNVFEHVTPNIYIYILYIYLYIILYTHIYIYIYIYIIYILYTHIYFFFWPKKEIYFGNTGRRPAVSIIFHFRSLMNNKWPAEPPHLRLESMERKNNFIF